MESKVKHRIKVMIDSLPLTVTSKGLLFLICRSR